MHRRSTSPTALPWPPGGAAEGPRPFAHRPFIINILFPSTKGAVHRRSVFGIFKGAVRGGKGQPADQVSFKRGGVPRGKGQCTSEALLAYTFSYVCIKQRYFILLYFIVCHFMLYSFILCHFILFYIILLYFTLVHFTLLYFIYYIVFRTLL